MNRIRTIFISSALLFFPTISVFAQSFTNILNDPNIAGRVFNVTNLLNLIEGIACWLIRFSVIAIAIMIVIYGIMFLKSRGTPAGMVSARKALTMGLLGALVISGVFTIILSVSAIIGVDYRILDRVSCG